jgi:2'-5' RNA ligase
MSAQASLFDFATPDPTDRLFLALFPDERTAARLRRLAEEVSARHGLRGNLIDAERLHITLFHIGDWVGLPPDTLKAALAASANLRAAPVEICLDQIASFTPQRSRPPLVLKASSGNTALRELRAALGRELTRAGLGRSVANAFEPHVTLSYPTQSIEPEAVELVRWNAAEFVLVHSLLGKTTYIPLDRWALRE